MLLLDTCTLLWLVGDQTKLSTTARELITEHADSLFVSAISAFEIALMHRYDRIRLPVAPGAWFTESLAHHGVNQIPVDSPIAVLATELRPLHKDPCDRMIIATAHLESLTILTPDERISAYPDVTVRW